MTIRFGTDGWRAIIAEDFTFDNVRLCAQGTANYLKRAGLAPRGLVVGYDTRFASDRFAATVAGVVAANGVPVFLCARPAPTPVVSYNLVTLDAGGGVVITASHNPAEWNGYKFKGESGGSAPQETVDELERLIAEAAEDPAAIKELSLPEAEGRGILQYVDPEPTYLGHVASLVDLQSIRDAGLIVVVDSMFGAGAGYFDKLLAGGSTRVTEINGEFNPAFPGLSQPEPLAQNLARLLALVPSTGADVGLATDGDADRLGVVDENGRFLTTLETFALLCLYHLEILHRRGPIVRSITMTTMVDKLGERYGVPVFDTPVGFKHLGPVMIRESALLAGEESGGYAIQGNVPERDGILSGLLMLDLVVKTGKSLPQLLEMLTDMVGPHHYDRWDVEFDAEETAEVHSRLRAASVSSLAGMQVDSIDTRDGYRFGLEGGYWGLVRFSGTEPLLRLYAEADSPHAVQSLLEELRDIAGV